MPTAINKFAIALLILSANLVTGCPYLRSTNRNLQGDFNVNIDALFANRQQISRNVQTTDIGVIATTTSADARVTQFIQDHVRQMLSLTGPIRSGDPLFATLFDHLDETDLNISFTGNGVIATHTGTTDCGVQLVRDHADQVSRFVNTGDRRPNFNWREPAACQNQSSTKGGGGGNQKGFSLVKSAIDDSSSSAPTETESASSISEESEAEITENIGATEKNSASAFRSSLVSSTIALAAIAALL